MKFIGNTFGVKDFEEDIVKVWECEICKSRYKTNDKPQYCKECENEKKKHHKQEGELGIL